MVFTNKVQQKNGGIQNTMVPADLIMNTESEHNHAKLHRIVLSKENNELYVRGRMRRQMEVGRGDIAEQSLLLYRQPLCFVYCWTGMSGKFAGVQTGGNIVIHTQP